MFGNVLDNPLAAFLIVVAQLPATFKDHLRARAGRNPSAAFMTYCHRSYFHGQWDVLLDEEFVDAYQNGIKIRCGDGVERLFYPRIFTYSADYPEKYVAFNTAETKLRDTVDRIAVATIRNLGNSPCPRCLVGKHDLHKLGMPSDTKKREKHQRQEDTSRRSKVEGAYKRIHELYGAIAGEPVEKELKEQSLIAIKVSRLTTSSF